MITVKRNLIKLPSFNIRLMKKLSVLSAIILLFAASCEIKVNTDDNESEQEPASVTAPGQPKTAVNSDPVCGMEKDNTWTEYSVTGTDTTWFCSPHCKESFEKNPGKYLNKKDEAHKG